MSDDGVYFQPPVPEMLGLQDFYGEPVKAGIKQPNDTGIMGVGDMICYAQKSYFESMGRNDLSINDMVTFSSSNHYGATVTYMVVRIEEDVITMILMHHTHCMCDVMGQH